jgi:hypothetical protein
MNNWSWTNMLFSLQVFEISCYFLCCWVLVLLLCGKTVCRGLFKFSHICKNLFCDLKYYLFWRKFHGLLRRMYIVPSDDGIYPLSMIKWKYSHRFISRCQKNYPTVYFAIWVWHEQQVGSDSPLTDLDKNYRISHWCEAHVSFMYRLWTKELAVKFILYAITQS